MRILALLLAASVAAATVYPGESSQWQIGSGDEHGVEPIPSDAVDCSPTSFGVLYFGGTGGNAYAEMIFTGNIAVYGLVSPSGGPVQVFVDDAFAFAFDEQLQTGAGPVHCAYMGTWFSPPEIDTSTAHTLRVVYSGDAQHRGFIVNATTSSAHTLPPFTTIFPPASSASAPSITVTAVPLPSPTRATVSRHISPRATYLIAIICLLVGLVLVGLALWGLTSWWRKRRAMRAPSAAFRAEAHAHERGGHSFPWQRRTERQPQMSEKAAPAPVVAPEAGPSTVG
ncbi:hypothetical protein EXIGLDRAFT_721422 [Exidia glandulosa HHB12029]|uniref:Uncharacterized protein n=1 Tax=Exidia glandulosa HHB12029 TaxID=1314781 RepID=A0A165FRA5_EXIGL|nr:hypothetical protein EXIGLDRAFT_721422 [Exidia glandulosa HHB12029]